MLLGFFFFILPRQDHTSKRDKVKCSLFKRERQDRRPKQNQSPFYGIKIGRRCIAPAAKWLPRQPTRFCSSGCLVMLSEVILSCHHTSREYIHLAATVMWGNIDFKPQSSNRHGKVQTKHRQEPGRFTRSASGKPEKVPSS